MADVRTESVTTCGWRLERWPTERSIAHMIFTDMFMVPTVDVFDQAADRAANLGFRAIRTSALFPRSQRTAIEAGFAPIDTLALFRLPISDDSTAPSPDRSEQLSTSTSRMRISQLTSAVEIDRLSFGPQWANSANSLRQILRATERSRGRVVRNPDGPRSAIIGFIMSGITDATGYIQRLAVDPNHRRQGVAAALVADSIDWMHRKGATSAFVNTGVDNLAAQSLYTSFGFVDTGEVLTINERVLIDAAPHQ